MPCNETWETERHSPSPLYSSPPASWSTWKNVLAACFPSTIQAPKQKRGRKQNVHGWTSAPPRGEECVCCVGGPLSLSLSAHGTQCILGEDCRWKTRAVGKEESAPEKCTYTHSHTCFFSLYIQPQWTAAPWYRLASLLQSKTKRVCEEPCQNIITCSCEVGLGGLFWAHLLKRKFLFYFALDK